MAGIEKYRGPKWLDLSKARRSELVAKHFKEVRGARMFSSTFWFKVLWAFSPMVPTLLLLSVVAPTLSLPRGSVGVFYVALNFVTSYGEKALANWRARKEFRIQYRQPTVALDPRSLLELASGVEKSDRLAIAISEDGNFLVFRSQGVNQQDFAWAPNAAYMSQIHSVLREQIHGSLQVVADLGVDRSGKRRTKLVTLDPEGRNVLEALGYGKGVQDKALPHVGPTSPAPDTTKSVFGDSVPSVDGAALLPGLAGRVSADVTQQSGRGQAL